MFDLLHKNVIGELFEGRVENSFDRYAAATKLSKRL